MSASTSQSTPEAQGSERNTASEGRESSQASEDGNKAVLSGRSVREDAEDPSKPARSRSRSISLSPSAEEPPPLPNEEPPGNVEDDGWDPVWDENAQAFYFYHRFTKVSQWENPRVPTVSEPASPGVGNHDRIEQPAAGNEPPPKISERPATTYDPAIHGDYDPEADYARPYQEAANGESAELHRSGTVDAADIYAASGAFNRFTGKWQAAALNPENFNDENKSRRQMGAYFDVDAAANSHDGKSLKAERSGKKLSKRELKAFRDKRRERKEEKRRAWLRD